MTYTAKKLLTMTDAELSDLFSRSEPGPIPNGQAQGTAIVAPGTPFTQDIAQVINIFAWQGKVFNTEKMALVNKISVFGLEAILAHISREPSWIDGKECIVLDYSKTSVVAHWVRDEMRLISPGFYLGRVFWKDDPIIYFSLEF
ncbi:hypothetical protein EJ04DRAFT_592377 [Polyplosphaeria fusca]|uniref:Uncharacterized protein n=1 Tax=Polyplosphaeria fusca TaxID=682080 RepID=A0A9P4UTT1_9PLEO|nr:hypothetical protein EJ04DRAFT_592377 [Polyplosphaeria fusca]